jgi:hypothetical protein
LEKLELENLKRDSKIFSIRHLDWISNLVVVKKKNGEIQICVDFRDINQASVNDNYLLPKLEMLLQQVTGFALISMLYGFSGYNQVLAVE